MGFSKVFNLRPCDIFICKTCIIRSQQSRHATAVAGGSGAVAEGVSDGGSWRDPILHGRTFSAGMLRLAARGGSAGQAAAPLAGGSALPGPSQKAGGGGRKVWEQKSRIFPATAQQGPVVGSNHETPSPITRPGA